MFNLIRGEVTITVWCFTVITTGLFVRKVGFKAVWLYSIVCWHDIFILIYYHIFSISTEISGTKLCGKNLVGSRANKLKSYWPSPNSVDLNYAEKCLDECWMSTRRKTILVLCNKKLIYIFYKWNRSKRYSLSLFEGI